MVSRWLWPGNRAFLEVASMVITWWIVAFLRSGWMLKTKEIDVKRKACINCLHLHVLSKHTFLCMLVAEKLVVRTFKKLLVHIYSNTGARSQVPQSALHSTWEAEIFIDFYAIFAKWADGIFVCFSANKNRVLDRFCTCLALTGKSSWLYLAQRLYNTFRNFTHQDKKRCRATGIQVTNG